MRKNPPTVELFEAHLLSKTPLGIYLLDDNEQVNFGAIDIDGFSHELALRIGIEPPLECATLHSKTSGIPSVSPALIPAGIHLVIQMANGIPFLIKKRDIYYLQKRVPKKLIPTIGREFVRLSLRTRDKATAIRTAGPILGALERDWHYQLFAIPVGTNVIDHFGSNTIAEPTLREAAASYIEMKGKAEDRKFTNPTNLVINAIVQQSGDKVISAYVRSDAVRFRDGLVRRGISQATIKRNLAIIRSIWNFAAREHGVDKPNPFANMNYGNSSGPVTRLPIPMSSIRKVQQQCVDIDDDIRWLIAIISDSGMRLSEAAGLIASDIHLLAAIPHVSVAEGGIMVTQNGVPFMQPDELTKTMQAFKQLFSDWGCYIAGIPTYAGGPMAFGWASQSASGRNVSIALLEQRFAEAALETRYYTPAVHKGAFGLPRYIEKLLP